MWPHPTEVAAKPPSCQRTQRFHNSATCLHATQCSTSHPRINRASVLPALSRDCKRCHRNLLSVTPEVRNFSITDKMGTWYACLPKMAKWLKLIHNDKSTGTAMHAQSVRDVKDNFGRLIDTARVEAVVIEKHARPVSNVTTTNTSGKRHG